MDSKKPKKELSYQELKKIWYDELKDKGFDDIEKNDYILKRPSSKFSNKETARDWYAKSEYSSMAGQFLNTYKFKSNLEKTIWEYHANGISSRDIADILREAKVRGKKRSVVQAIIKRLADCMKEIYLVGHKN